MMKRLIRAHLFRSFSQHFGLQAATMSVLIGTFVVISLSLLFHQNLNSVLSRWGDSIVLSVYLKSDTTDLQMEDVGKRLKSDIGFNKVEFVTKEKAAKEFLSQMSSVAPEVLFDNDFGNPLPSSYEVKLEANSAMLGQLEELTSKIKQWVGVEDVSYGQGWLSDYQAVVRAFSRSSFILIGVLLAGSLFVISNAIGSSIAQRRVEVEILELIGATRRSITSPYLVEGFIMGLSAAFMALILSYSIFSWQSQAVGSGLGFWALGARFSFLSWYRSLFVLILGGAFGALGAKLAIRKISTGWAAAEGIEGQ